MSYIRTSLFDLRMVDVENDQIIQNEVSLGRWIVDALSLLLTVDESYDLKRRIQIKQLGFSYIPDIYLERGCEALQLKGKTIIEIKNNLLFDTEIRQSEVYKILIDDCLVDNLCIIYINSNKSSLPNTHLPGRITFVNANTFINQAKKAINAGKGTMNNALRNGERKNRKPWIEIREERLANAINDFNRYNTVIFAGAGVSASANIPDWNKLLKSILAKGTTIMEDDYDNVYKEMDYSNLVTARYIQKSLNIDMTSLVNHIRKLLYPNNISSESELIKSICELIVKQKNIRSVITYNYDTLVEDCLIKLKKPCFSVYKNNRDENNTFPVYHVHGIIFRDNNGIESEEIVLSEKDYHRVYSEVFDWSNVEQLHALTRCTCFFIGLSMKDPNLRRLLEIAQRNSGKAVRHYVFLERKSVYNEFEKAEKDFQTREDLLADLGLNVIWYKGNDNHRELPMLLKHLHE